MVAINSASNLQKKKEILVVKMNNCGKTVGNRDAREALLRF